jgi:hypothetical protein
MIHTLTSAAAALAGLLCLIAFNWLRRGVR